MRKCVSIWREKLRKISFAGWEEARFAALRSFGGIERVKEESRDERGTRLLEEILQDLRYDARMLWKKPGFTLVAVLTLGLGIGANTAVFTLINAFLLRSLPVPNPHELVAINALNIRGKQSGFFGAFLSPCTVICGRASRSSPT
jgi:hypothetical protein